MRALSVREQAYEHSREHTHRPTDKTGGRETNGRGRTRKAEGGGTERGEGRPEVGAINDISGSLVSERDNIG